MLFFLFCGLSSAQSIVYKAFWPNGSGPTAAVTGNVFDWVRAYDFSSIYQQEFPYNVSTEDDALQLFSNTFVRFDNRDQDFSRYYSVLLLTRTDTSIRNALQSSPRLQIEFRAQFEEFMIYQEMFAGSEVFVMFGAETSRKLDGAQVVGLATGAETGRSSGDVPSPSAYYFVSNGTQGYFCGAYACSSCGCTYRLGLSDPLLHDPLTPWVTIRVIYHRATSMTSIEAFTDTETLIETSFETVVLFPTIAIGTGNTYGRIANLTITDLGEPTTQTTTTEAVETPSGTSSVMNQSSFVLPKSPISTETSRATRGHNGDGSLSSRTPINDSAIVIGLVSVVIFLIGCLIAGYILHKRRYPRERKQLQSNPQPVYQPAERPAVTYDSIIQSSTILDDASESEYELIELTHPSGSQLTNRGRGAYGETSLYA